MKNKEKQYILEDLEREMNSLINMFQVKATQVSGDGEYLGQLSYWNNPKAEARYKQLEEQYKQLASQSA